MVSESRLAQAKWSECVWESLSLPTYNGSITTKYPAPVLSPRLAEAVRAMDLYGIELVPAVVRHTEDPSCEPKDYYFLYVWNRIHCLDRQNSDLELYGRGRIFGFRKLVLLADTLLRFDISKRLIFELAEKPSVLLVHETVREAMESVKPQEVRFFRATEWNSDLAFS